MPLQHNDRAPRLGTPPPVDFVGPGIDLVLQHLVLTDAGAARDGDLDEYQTLPILRMGCEQAVESPKPFQDSLGIVDAIHSHTKQAISNAQLAFPPCLVFLSLF